MDLRSIKAYQFENDYSNYESDSNWAFFKEHVIPSLVDRKCCICLKEFSCEYTIKRHYCSFHNEKLPINIFYTRDENYFCEICNKSFSRQDKYKEHIRFSKTHKSILISRKNQNLSIKDLFEKTKKRALDESQKYDEIANKRQRVQNSENDSNEPFENQQQTFIQTNISNNENPTEQNDVNETINKINDEEDKNDEIILIKVIDPIEKMNKSELLEMKKKIHLTYNVLQRKYKFVSEMLKKFD